MANETSQRTESPAQPRSTRASYGASPVAAAAFAAGIIYLWMEALFRLLFTYYPSFNADWQLWNGRVGDIAAMWLTIAGVAGVAGLGLWWLWRRHDRVGSIAIWTIVLLASAVSAPMIGEIGTPAGSPSTGNGSSSAAAIIAYLLLGIVLVVTAALLARLRTRR